MAETPPTSLMTTVDLTRRTTPLTRADALHLVRRITLHGTRAAAEPLVGLTPAEALDRMWTSPADVSTPSWTNEIPDGIPPATVVTARWSEMVLWWIRQLGAARSLQERMVLFWHGFFTSDYVTVYVPQFMMRQNGLFRQHALGSYRTLATAMVADPAMLIYLNGNVNVKSRPNENFAREWFELFSLGVGNYAEHDIVEAARAFTGWGINGLEGRLRPSQTDTGTKTILGQTGAWGYTDVVRITLEQPACSRFLARALLRTFFENDPSPAGIDAVAATIVAADYDIGAVLRTLLASEAFYDVRLRGALIKSPAQFVMTAIGQVGLDAMAPSTINATMAALEQQVFYPPTVEGWKGHHAWITSSSFPLRQRLAEGYIAGRLVTGGPVLDEGGTALSVAPVEVVRSYAPFNDAEALVAAVAEAMLAVPVTAEQQAVLLDILLAGIPAYEWSLDEPGAVARVRTLLQTIVRMPEYQLT